MNQGRIKRLIDRCKNDARKIVKRDKQQHHLVTDLIQTLNLLDFEVRNPTLRKEELPCRTNPLEDQEVRTSSNLE